MTEEEHLDAWKTRLAAALGVVVYDHDEAEQAEQAGELAGRYLILYLTRRAVDTVLMSGPALNRGWRLQTRCVGTSRYECADLRDGLEQEIYRLPFPAIGAGLVARDVDTDPPALDAERWSAFDSWTYFTPR